MPQAAIPWIMAASLGLGVQQAYSQQEAATDAKHAANANLDEQKKATEKLKTEVAAAPEQARLDELDKRRKRVQTLLTSQQDMGMATVGQKTLLGG